MNEDKLENKENKVKKVIKKNKKVNPEILKLTTEKAELTDKVLRLTAEMQNMTRRFNEEKMNIYKYDGEKIVKELLPILDNFERAIMIDESKLSSELSKFLTGFKMIYTSFLSLLESIGVKEIEALGKEFDPNKMQAIMTTNIMDEEQNIVVDVMQKGYMYNDKVIRVAMVKVNE